LPHCSRYERPKLTQQVAGQLLLPEREGARVEGFLLHHGRMLEATEPLLLLDGDLREGSRQDALMATMVHRLFDHPSARAAFLGWLREHRGLPAAPAAPEPREDPYERLARELQNALDWPRVLDML
jgi:cobyric acid synthase